MDLMSPRMPYQPPSKNKIREQLEADTRAFLRKGGKITEIAQGRINVKSGKDAAFILVKKPDKEQR